MIYITASGAQPIASQAYGISIQVNASLTGFITVTAAGSTQYGTAAQTIAVITNPSVGNSFNYSGLHTKGAISVNPSATTDISVSILNRPR